MACLHKFVYLIQNLLPKHSSIGGGNTVAEDAIGMSLKHLEVDTDSYDRMQETNRENWERREEMDGVLDKKQL